MLLTSQSVEFLRDGGEVEVLREIVEMKDFDRIGAPLALLTNSFDRPRIRIRCCPKILGTAPTHFLILALRGVCDPRR